MSDAIANEPKLITLVPGKSDAEMAADFKARAIAVYTPVMELCTEANAAGFDIQIASAVGPIGHVITLLKVSKFY